MATPMTDTPMKTKDELFPVPINPEWLLWSVGWCETEEDVWENFNALETDADYGPKFLEDALVLTHDFIDLLLVEGQLGKRRSYEIAEIVANSYRNTRLKYDAAFRAQVKQQERIADAVASGILPAAALHHAPPPPAPVYQTVALF